MKTKVRLNCYFFSNLIVGLLILNCLFSNDKVLVEVKKDGGKLEPIYAIADTKVEENEITKEVKDVTQDDVKVLSVSVTKKTLASKKVINYVKPSYNSVTGSALVNYAKHYLGLPYISAGRSLERGTDCSGFTRLIFREFGINLGTTVASQIYSGSYVSKADLQPGDLVFYGYSTRATHVAIYIGGGQIIHESNPRDGVKISSVNIMVYITARRLITGNVQQDKKEEVKPDNKEVVKESVKDTNQNLEVVPDNKVQEPVITTKEEEKVTTPSVLEKTEKEIQEEIKKEEDKVPTPETDIKQEESKEEQKPSLPEEPKESQPSVQEEIKKEVKEEPQEEVKKEEIKPEPPKVEEVPETSNKDVQEKEVVPEVKQEVPAVATPKIEAPSIEEPNEVDNSKNSQESSEEIFENEK